MLAGLIVNPRPGLDVHGSAGKRRGRAGKIAQAVVVCLRQDIAAAEELQVDVGPIQGVRAMIRPCTVASVVSGPVAVVPTSFARARPARIGAARPLGLQREGKRRRLARNVGVCTGSHHCGVATTVCRSLASPTGWKLKLPSDCGAVEVLVVAGAVDGERNRQSRQVMAAVSVPPSVSLAVTLSLCDVPVSHGAGSR